MIPGLASGASTAAVIDPAMPDKAEPIPFQQASATRPKGIANMFSGQAKVIRDANGRRITTTARGYQVLRDPALNKGTAFSAAERRALGLDGLLPPVVTTELEPELERAYAAYLSAPTDLAKHIYMWRLHDHNVTLFYALLQRHMLEMLPVVYDPEVGEAIENFSEVMTRPRGVFLSIDDPDSVEERLANFGAGPDEIDLLVASDAEEILGIGDWGFERHRHFHRQARGLHGRGRSRSA
jgi:malate dehydrogenase (oxaloacetate-decarboxylating)